MIRGEDLYHRRRERGWSLAKAGRVIGIHSSTLWRYEMNLVQHIDPKIQERLRAVYWPEENSGHTVLEGSGNPGSGEMGDEEFLRRYRHLDARSKKRIQMFLRQL